MIVRRVLLAVALIAALVVGGVGCSDDDGGSGGAAGTYVHEEEGTITLSGGGQGTWEQEGNESVYEFDWSQEGDVITFDDGGDTAEARIEDGDLVLGPDMISGDEDQTFVKQ